MKNNWPTSLHFEPCSLVVNTVTLSCFSGPNKTEQNKNLNTLIQIAS